MFKKDWGLIPRLFVAILLGTLVGKFSFLPSFVLRIPVTFSNIFSQLLAFIIPMMIIAFVVDGLSKLSAHSGKMLGVLVGISYTSLVTAAIIAYTVGSFLFPYFTGHIQLQDIEKTASLQSLLAIKITPFVGVTEAILFSFVVGISLAVLNRKQAASYLAHVFSDFEKVIHLVLEKFVIPLLPFYIFGNFVNLSYSGGLSRIFKIFGAVWLTILVLHFTYLAWLIFLGSRFSKQPFLSVMKKSLPAYLTAFGSQSSAVSIPINITCAQENGISKSVSEFMFPITGSMHMPGSVLTITSYLTAILMINGMDHSLSVMIPFILTFALAMTAAPGVPGGAVMTALPYLGLVGIDPSGTMASLLITLYLLQDSFGTSINVTSDQGIAPLLDVYYQHNSSL